MSCSKVHSTPTVLHEYKNLCQYFQFAIFQFSIYISFSSRKLFFLIEVDIFCLVLFFNEKLKLVVAKLQNSAREGKLQEAQHSERFAARERLA